MQEKREILLDRVGSSFQDISLLSFSTVLNPSISRETFLLLVYYIFDLQTWMQNGARKIVGPPWNFSARLSLVKDQWHHYHHHYTEPTIFKNIYKGPTVEDVCTKLQKNKLTLPLVRKLAALPAPPTLDRVNTP